jgi:hypothetical protein
MMVLYEDLVANKGDPQYSGIDEPSEVTNESTNPARSDSSEC